jgi:YegS/Rv2252/BmrU family lipid kinase
MARRALLIINSKSRSGQAALQAAIEGLRRHGIEPLHRECGSSDQLSPLIAEHGAGFDMVVVGGGDGTLNAAAAGIVETGRPLGILPTGTANDLARTLDIPADLDAAIAIIAAGHRRRIDVGSVNDRLFFNVASIGLSTKLARELTPDLKRRFGKIGYAVAALRVLSRARPFRVEIFNSGQRARSFSLQVAVGNGRFYGGGNIVASEAGIDDGVLDLYSLQFVRAWRLLLMLWSFRRGEHTARDEVRHLRDTGFEVHTRRPKSVNADGEIVTKTPAVFKILPKAIEVFVPSDRAV